MQVDDNAEKKWREKSVESDDGLRTLECLRGRLLAERTASRAAKEEEELMDNKLIKLEMQLKAEIDAKNRAEKKLKFLKKKLKSLKLEPISDQLSSSETSSVLKDPKDARPDPEIADSIKCDKDDETRERKEATISIDPSYDASQMHWSEASSGSVVITTPEELGKELVVTDDLRLSLTSSIRIRESSNESENEEGNPTEDVDNSLAIVPVSTPTTPQQSREPEPPHNINSDSVKDVLVALRHAKEKLHSYIGTRDGNHGFRCHSLELCGRV